MERLREKGLATDFADCRRLKKEAGDDECTED